MFECDAKPAQSADAETSHHRFLEYLTTHGEAGPSDLTFDQSSSSLKGSSFGSSKRYRLRMRINVIAFMGGLSDVEKRV